MFGNLTLQLLPQIVYGMKVWRLARPLQDLNVLLLEPLFCCLGRVLGSLSCWKTHPRPISNALALTLHRPFDAVHLSCTRSRKTPPQHNVCPSMFNGEDDVFEVIGSIPPPPNTASSVDAKKLDFGLIWPQLFPPVLLWIIDFRRLYMCFLEQGDLATVLLCFIHLWIITQLLPSCLAMVLFIPALCRSTIVSRTSLDSSLVLAMVESLESDWLIVSVDRCILYR